MLRMVGSSHKGGLHACDVCLLLTPPMYGKREALDSSALEFPTLGSNLKFIFLFFFQKEKLSTSQRDPWTHKWSMTVERKRFRVHANGSLIMVGSGQ